MKKLNVLFGKAPVLYDREILKELKLIRPNQNFQQGKRNFLLDFPYVFFNKGKNICHINSPNQLPLAFIYKKLFNANIIYSLHGVPKPLTIKLQANFLLKVLHILQLSFFRIFSKYVDIFISCSEYIKKELLFFYGYNSKKIFYGIRNDKFYPPINNKKVKKNISEKENVILFVARFTPYKDPLTLLKALRKLKCEINFDAIFINGAGKAPLYGEIMDKIEKYNLKDHTQVYNKYLSHKILKGYYQGADVLVLPSIGEAFGTVTSEAIACGTPVIVSNLGGPADIINKAALKFKVKNWKDLYEKLKLYLSDEDIQRKMKKEAIKRSKELTWNYTAKQILEIYNKI